MADLLGRHLGFWNLDYSNFQNPRSLAFFNGFKNDAKHVVRLRSQIGQYRLFIPLPPYEFNIFFVLRT